MREHPTTNRAARRLAALVLILILPLAGFASGRENEGPNPGNPSQIERDSEVAKLIAKTKKARVLTPSGEKLIRLPALVDGGIEGDVPGSGRLTVPWAEVLEIRIQKRFTVVGGVAGMAAGALFGFIAAQHLATDDGDLTEHLTGMAAWAVLGALPGLFLGSAITRWKTVYTSAPGAPIVPRISLVPTRRGGMAFSLSLSF